MMMRAELGSDRARCYGCGALLVAATTVSRSSFKVRSGEWIGSLGEHVTVRCACGRRVRLLWAVNIGPRQDRAA